MHVGLASVTGVMRQGNGALRQAPTFSHTFSATATATTAQASRPRAGTVASC